MNKVYVITFKEWGYEEGEDDSFYVLGVYTDHVEATEQFKIEDKRKHGIAYITEVELNKIQSSGW